MVKRAYVLLAHCLVEHLVELNVDRSMRIMMLYCIEANCRSLVLSQLAITVDGASMNKGLIDECTVSETLELRDVVNSLTHTDNEALKRGIGKKESKPGRRIIMR